MSSLLFLDCDLFNQSTTRVCLNFCYEIDTLGSVFVYLWFHMTLGKNLMGICACIIFIDMLKLSSIRLYLSILPPAGMIKSIFLRLYQYSVLVSIFLILYITTLFCISLMREVGWVFFLCLKAICVFCYASFALFSLGSWCSIYI